MWKDFAARHSLNIGQILAPQILALLSLASNQDFVVSTAVWIRKKSPAIRTQTLRTNKLHTSPRNIPSHHPTIPDISPHLVLIPRYPARAHGITSRDVPQSTPHYAIPRVSPCVREPTPPRRRRLGANLHTHDSAEDPQRFTRDERTWATRLDGI